MTAEEARLQQIRDRRAHWNRWGPYLSERAWGTVREDYSAHGTAWEYLPHDHARSKAYRWNEDGLAGICDRHQRICFALALWNGRDPILKERIFGLTGNEGNHGEDAKECYFYLDSTPTHSYMKYLYKYPQAPFPYEQLVAENRRRGKDEREFELIDTGVFHDNRYFDVFVEYAKASPDDILVQITVANRGMDDAPIHVLPTVWFRNTWSWSGAAHRPSLHASADGVIELNEPKYGKRWLLCDGSPALLFTENETHSARLYGYDDGARFVKDSIHDAIVHGAADRVNPGQRGTKAAAHYQVTVPAGQAVSLRLRLTDAASHEGLLDRAFDEVFEQRRAEADEFYNTVIPAGLSPDARNVMRQSFGGLLWSKQFYHYVVGDWIKGDAAAPPPPAQRRHGRNHEWGHLYNADVISMPDKWEYPWYAAWDLAFHCVPLALVDSEFAKDQLTLMVREWYMHPNGQLPAYEWAFGDVNPPVHSWAALRVYKIEKKRRGVGDRAFLKRIFHKLLLNFTWWVNRKDAEGRNVFQGGFLGLDNIGVFDRSAPLPTGGHIEQADGTGWMAMYSLNLLAIALELAKEDPSYEDVASKFWEHFLYIAHAMNHLGHDSAGMWDEHDGFFYDVLHRTNDGHLPLKVRSMVGLIPLFAVETLEPQLVDRLPGFRRRLEWFVENRPDLCANVACMCTEGAAQRRLLSIVDEDQLRSVLRFMLDESEFLSPYGIRALSRVHKDQPYSLQVDGQEYRVGYEPAESSTGLFGGNSNWRGPIWFPVNYLLIESLQKFHHYLGDSFQVECPTGSGQYMNLWEVAAELSRRLTHIFLRGPAGARPVHGPNGVYQTDPHWRDLVLFYEYFHGDDGSGVGASHQTGWTGLVAKLMQQSGE
ncbi:MGH1-like glycoside hydrolase domain-containing protein [Paludibaculum fermentans]|uniref:MGH1-like glycoside hydrolase domain-containing protein n=1 Tax=Paludibaculum fermentans TaxID=1473598 RepID=UPI003EB99D57